MVCLFFIAALFFSAVQCAPNWSQTYTVKGTLYIPYAELKEPFYAWYDAKNGQSRIDYYGGMVKTYQLSGVTKYGTSLKVAPITTEQELNSNKCLQVNGSVEAKIEPQSVLPSLVDFECIGSEVVNGQTTEKWQMITTIGQKVNKYTMWMRYMDDPNDLAIKAAVPVRYEMKGFNSLLGSHYDHYYLEYEAYSVNDISQEIFQVDDNMPCMAFPGPGVKHILTFNPMREFIHPASDEHVSYEFAKFQNKHNRVYASQKEHVQRKEVFRQNLRFIQSKNRANKGYSLAVNHLADRTDLELQALRGKKYSGVYNGGQPFPYKHVDGSSFPIQFDWRLYGAVSPVKDQSVCGSCWSFGTVGAIEGAYFLHNGGNLVRLSQQALVDCSWGYGNNGCDGGEDFRAYQWMMKHGGIPSEEEYGPYLGQDGYCHIANVTMHAKITGFVNVTTNDVNSLKQAMLKNGPISVAIDASHKTFSFYSNGVYYEPTCGNKEDQLDHAVLAVGYGVLNGQPYWLVKNSWSNYWGNDGYVLMSMKNNNCGVMTTPTYVTM